MSLLDAPIWNDAGTWIVLGVSLLFIVVGIAMHRIIMKVVRLPLNQGIRMSDILKNLRRQSAEVAAAKKKMSLEDMRRDAESRISTRDFVGALRAKIAHGGQAVIAEVKKASPARA